MNLVHRDEMAFHYVTHCTTFNERADITLSVVNYLLQLSDITMQLNVTTIDRCIYYHSDNHPRQWRYQISTRFHCQAAANALSKEGCAINHV